MRLSMIIIIVAGLVVAIAFAAIIFRGPKRMTVIMNQEPDNTYVKKGLKEFSSNFDVEWLDTFQKNISHSRVDISESDFRYIKDMCGSVKGDKRVVKELTLTAALDNNPCEAFAVIEWDDFSGHILRIYSDNEEFLKIVEDTWVKTTEELGV